MEGLTEKQYAKIKEELEDCKNPLFFLHDDPDGLCSFLLLRRYKGDGKGIMVKSTPRVTEEYLRYVNEHNPDKIFIVDIAMVDQEFIDKAKAPVIWIDHHEPLKRSNVLYFNPREHEMENKVPASFLCYETVKQDLWEDLWIGAVGTIADWHLPKKMAKDFSEKYPDLLPKNIVKPQDALFTTKIGQLARIFSFILMGKISDANKRIELLTKVQSPYEILNQETEAAKKIYKAYEKVNKEYEKLIQEAEKNIPAGKILTFTYSSNLSITKDISNEMLYRHPDKIIVISREKDDEMKISLRASVQILPALKKTFEKVAGFGGGHEHACGAVVKKKDYDDFIMELKKELKI